MDWTSATNASFTVSKVYQTHHWKDEFEESEVQPFDSLIARSEPQFYITPSGAPDKPTKQHPDNGTFGSDIIFKLLSLHFMIWDGKEGLNRGSMLRTELHCYGLTLEIIGRYMNKDFHAGLSLDRASRILDCAEDLERDSWNGSPEIVEIAGRQLGRPLEETLFALDDIARDPAPVIETYLVSSVRPFRPLETIACRFDLSPFPQVSA